jgi:hypothetical protein
LTYAERQTDVNLTELFASMRICSSKQTAIISLYRINLPAFVKDSSCVYCAVQTEYLSFRVLPRSGFYPSSVSGNLCGQCGIGLGFSPSTSVFLSQYHSTNIQSSFSSKCCSYKEDKRPVTSKTQFSFKNRGPLYKKYIYLFLNCRYNTVELSVMNWFSDDEGRL